MQLVADPTEDTPGRCVLGFLASSPSVTGAAWTPKEALGRSGSLLLVQMSFGGGSHPFGVLRPFLLHGCPPDLGVKESFPQCQNGVSGETMLWG